MAAIPRVRQLMGKLPEDFFYAKLIGGCYGEFYKFFYTGRLDKLKCFGPERCQVGIPRGGDRLSGTSPGGRCMIPLIKLGRMVLFGAAIRGA